jgi:hypoxanthine-DNA glycosylase
VTHPFEPIYDENCEKLILGTFPSVQSREFGFYYGHPRTRFWSVLAAVYSEPAAMTIAEKTAFLLRHRLALWDVLESCEITGSDDSSIRSPVANDIAKLTNSGNITGVLCNGGKAFELYERYVNLPVPVLKLPSTSPANAAWTLAKLAEKWSEALR